jgi:hypothetical protein
MIRPRACVRPEQSFWLHAIYQGRACSCCVGVMPADGSGSGPLILPTLNGPFPYRLCEGCVALSEDAPAEVLQRVVTAVAIEGCA